MIIGMLDDALSLLQSHLKGNPLVVAYHKQIVSLLSKSKDYERYQPLPICVHSFVDSDLGSFLIMRSTSTYLKTANQNGG